MVNQTTRPMQLGMVGLGRMGANMVARLTRAGHRCVGFDLNAENVKRIVEAGAEGASSAAEFVAKLQRPRVVWLMVPAAVVDASIASLEPLLDDGDVVIDGGNSHYHDDIRRAERLAARGVRYVDVGVSGGVWGLENGYALMIGGDAEAVRRVEPIFDSLCPGVGDAERTPGRGGDAAPEERGYLHCGPPGAGHFVKMVHNGIEYGVMAAFAEGFNLLRRADAGSEKRAADAETTPLRDPHHYRYNFDLGAIAEVWRRGTVIRSWLLDLTAAALQGSPGLDEFSGHVSDSGEGRWTIQAAIEVGVPAPVLSAALFSRFSSRGEDDFANKVLSAMRKAFGGHVEKKR
jgi:6-phosphogluconate dehydrogenase